MGKTLVSALLIALAVAVSANLANFKAVQYGNDPSDIIYVGNRPAYDQTQFKGKNALVTGGSSGMGFAAALTLARFGANVVIVSRDSNPEWFTGARAVEKIQNDETVKENGGTIKWYKCDVSNMTEMTALFDEFDKTNFMLDYAINNAGIVGAVQMKGALFNDTVPYFGGEHDAVKNNLIGTVLSLEFEMKQFLKTKKNGAIVNTASVNGYRASPLGPLYATSKFGIIGLTRSVGVEYARGTPVVRVNAIAPGFTNTSLVWQQVKVLSGECQTWEGKYITPSDPLWQQYAPLFKSKCPTGDLADPMDQANMMAFLLSDSAELITGSVFTVDGLIGE
jgi:NAD(P)-dependent dehydrogenase (short-subunit alcohol dehydrogenase family)